MSTFTEIHQKIEKLSEERGDLYKQLSTEYDAAVAADIRRLDRELDVLWDELRALRAQVRFGDRNHIVARARVEERLERAA